MSRGVGRVVLLTLAAVLATVAAGSITSAEAAARSVLAPKKASLRSELKKVGVVVQYDVDYGIPGLNGMVGQGLVVTPVEEATHKRAIAPFTVVGGSVGFFAKRRYLSPNKRFRGTETGIAHVNSGSPVYGDRVQVPLVPGLIYIGASRQGGLGITIAPLRLPFAFGGALVFPLLRGALSIYVTHPLLARPANWILDKNDLLLARLGRLMRPVKARFTALKLKLKARWQRATRPPEDDYRASEA